jgi:hypothetical protein
LRRLCLEVSISILWGFTTTARCLQYPRPPCVFIGNNLLLRITSRNFKQLLSGSIAIRRRRTTHSFSALANLQNQEMDSNRILRLSAHSARHNRPNNPTTRLSFVANRWPVALRPAAGPHGSRHPPAAAHRSATSAMPSPRAGSCSGAFLPRTTGPRGLVSP